LSGTGWDIALYAGPTTATSYSQMTLLTLETAFGTKTALPWALGTTTQPTSVPAGGANANYEVFIWNYTAGNALAIGDAGAAQAAFAANTPGFELGSTPVLTIGGSTGLGGGSILPPNTEFQSFDLLATSTPEPATLAIAGIGAAGLLLFRRKK